MIEVATGMLAMPVIDLLLQSVPFGEQVAIDRGEIADKLCQAGPEVVGAHADSRQKLRLNKLVENRVRRQSVNDGPVEPASIFRKHRMHPVGVPDFYQ